MPPRSRASLVSRGSTFRCILGCSAQSACCLPIAGMTMSAACPAAFAEHAAKAAPVESSREAYFGPQTGRVHTRVIQRASLVQGKCQGPAIIEEFDSTIVVPPRWSASLDRLGNVVMESQPGREA